jgi:23S rRNA (uracil1939-C5)-methyltransferase
MKKLLHIEKLVHGGLGLARTDEGVLFVSDVLPGEKVDALPDTKPTGQKGALPLTIVEPSPHRRKPPCVYFGICGGCDWLFGDYEVQLSSKKAIFIECLKRIGKIASMPDFEVFPSPEFGYRRRVQFKIDRIKNAIGFYKRKSREVVPIRHCPLLTPGLNSLLAVSEDIIQRLSPTLTQMKCIEGEHHCIASSPVIVSRTFPFTDIRIGNHSFVVSGDGFFQGNAYLCEKLGTWGKDIVHGDLFVDLYGGVGFFSIMLHRCFSTGLIVDNVESQIILARRNLHQNGISHIIARAEDAEQFLSKCCRSHSSIDCLIVDPPRQGLTKKIREKIVQCLPSTLFYVSCNPSTQARDIGFFIHTAGYFINKMALFDLYPNTHHMETIIVLRR